MKRKIHKQKKWDHLIENLISNNAIISTSINLFAEHSDHSVYQNGILNDHSEIFNPSQLERYSNSFESLMKRLHSAHNRGLKLTIGTDSKNGGEVFLTEMILLKKIWIYY